MIIIILLFTSVSVLILLIGFLEIHLPFIISKAKAITNYSTATKVNYKQQKKLAKRDILYKNAHIGFMDMENSL